jgi:hypothetical protein
VTTTFTGDSLQESRLIYSPVDTGVFFEESSLHATFFGFKFAQSVLGESLAFTPLSDLPGRGQSAGDAATLHLPPVANEDAFIFLEACARALVLGFLALDSQTFKLAPRS